MKTVFFALWHFKKGFPGSELENLKADYLMEPGLKNSMKKST